MNWIKYPDEIPNNSEKILVLYEDEINKELNICYAISIARYELQKDRVTLKLKFNFQCKCKKSLEGIISDKFVKYWAPIELPEGLE